MNSCVPKFRINKDRHSLKLAEQGLTNLVEKLSSDVTASSSASQGSFNTVDATRAKRGNRYHLIY